MILILYSLQGFSFRKTDFHFYQLLLTFLDTFFQTFYHSIYTTFLLYLPDNSFHLKFDFFATLCCLLISTLVLLLKFFTAFFMFSRSSYLFYMSFLNVNSFHHTKYFVIPLFLFVQYFLTFHSFSLSNFTSFSFFIFCSLTGS